MKNRLWRVVSSLEFVNAVHDVTLVGGTVFLIAYFYWLLGRK